MSESAGEELIERARRGEPAALDELLRQHEPRLFRFGMKMCRDPEDASDIAQETLLAAFRNIHSFRGASSVSTWLYSIARSFCIKKRRRRKHAPDTLLSLEGDGAEESRALHDPRPRPDEVFEERALGEALEAAIGRLAPGHREVLVLRDVEGLSAREVAEVTGISVQAVKSRLHRARVAVREALLPVLEPGAATGETTESACTEIVPIFSRHLEGEIAPEVCRELEQHVEGCPRCRQACDSLRRLLGLCRATPLPEVPRQLQDSIREGIRGLLSRLESEGNG